MAGERGVIALAAHHHIEPIDPEGRAEIEPHGAADVIRVPAPGRPLGLVEPVDGLVGGAAAPVFKGVAGAAPGVEREIFALGPDLDLGYARHFALEVANRAALRGDHIVEVGILLNLDEKAARRPALVDHGTAPLGCQRLIGGPAGGVLAEKAVAL